MSSSRASTLRPPANVRYPPLADGRRVRFRRLREAKEEGDTSVPFCRQRDAS